MDPKTTTAASDKTVTDLPAAAPPVTVFARYKAWMAGKPWYYHIIAVALATLIGGAVGHYFPAAKPYIPDPMLFGKAAPAEPQPQVVAAPAPAADVPLVEGLLPRGELRKRIALRFARNAAVDRAVKDGIPGPDGKVKKVTREQAEAAVAGVSDALILGAVEEVGAPFGEGGRLEAFLSWLWEHREQIIKLILSLVALFGDQPN